MFNIRNTAVRWLFALALSFSLSACFPMKKAAFLKTPQQLDQEEREVAALTHFSYAQYLLQAGQASRAVEELRTALTYDPQSIHLRRALAYMLLQQGKIDEALSVVDEAIRLRPESAVLHHIRGLILLEKRKMDEAQAEFKRATELDPDSTEFAVSLAECHLRRNQPDQALSVLQAFAKAHPEDLDSQFYVAIILQGGGRVDEAAAAYRHLLELAPGFYPAQRNLFNLYLDLRRWEDAVPVGQELLLSYPDDVDSRMGLAQALLRLERDEEAILILEQGKAVQSSPALWVLEGHIFLDQERPKPAIEQFEGALKLDPLDRQANFGLGLAALQERNWAEAKKQFEIIAPPSPLFFEAQKRLAWLALQEGDVDRAMQLAQTVLDLRPQDPDAIGTFAAVAREAGKYDLAIETLKKGAAAAKTTDDNLVYDLAVVYSLSGDHDQAREIARQLLQKHPDDPRALNFLGYLMAERGENLDEAEKLIRRALEKDPEAGYILDSLGWVFYQRGEYKTALKYLQQAERQTGPDPEILEHLGDCHVKLGRRTDARSSYNRALSAGATPRIRERIEKKLKELK